MQLIINGKCCYERYALEWRIRRLTGGSSDYPDIPAYPDLPNEVQFLGSNCIKVRMTNIDELLADWPAHIWMAVAQGPIGFSPLHQHQVQADLHLLHQQSAPLLRQCGGTRD